MMTGFMFCFHSGPSAFSLYLCKAEKILLWFAIYLVYNIYNGSEGHLYGLPLDTTNLY